jgi:chromosome segregation ATPase
MGGKQVAESLLNQQEPKTDTKIEDLQGQNNHLRRIIGIILSLVLVVLTVYVLHLQNQNSNTLVQSTDLALTATDRALSNYRTYVGKYKETKAQLEETTRKLEAVNLQLDQVSAELATTKGMLSQTQGMLSDAQQENIKLKQELLGLDKMRNTDNVQNIDELQAKIKSLKEKDVQVSGQLADLKEQMRAFEAQFSNVEEGKSLVVLFQNKIRLVKARMNYLSQEAFMARIKVQKEKDRLAVLNGNNGFVLRNGKLQNPNGTSKSFAIDVKIVQ